MQVSVKTVLGNDIRRFSTDSFENLVETVQDVYSLGRAPITLRYRDSDGDEIYIGTTRELCEAQSCSSGGVPRITILVHENIPAPMAGGPAEELKHDTNFAAESLAEWEMVKRERIEEQHQQQRLAEKSLTNVLKTPPQRERPIEPHLYNRDLDGMLQRCHNELRPFVPGDPFANTRQAFDQDLQRLLLTPATTSASGLDRAAVAAVAAAEGRAMPPVQQQGPDQGQPPPLAIPIVTVDRSLSRASHASAVLSNPSSQPSQQSTPPLSRFASVDKSSVPYTSTSKRESANPNTQSVASSSTYASSGTYPSGYTYSSRPSGYTYSSRDYAANPYATSYSLSYGR